MDFDGLGLVVAGWRINLPLPNNKCRLWTFAIKFSFFWTSSNGFLILILDLRLRLRDWLFRVNSCDLVDRYFRPKRFSRLCFPQDYSIEIKNQKSQIKNQKDPTLIYPNVQIL